MLKIQYCIVLLFILSSFHSMGQLSSIDLLTGVNITNANHSSSAIKYDSGTGYRVGVDVNFNLSKRVYVKTGLRMTSTSYSSSLLRSPSELMWGSQHNGQGGFDPNLPGGTIYASNSDEFPTLSFTSVELPLIAGIQIIQKSIELSLELGTLIQHVTTPMDEISSEVSLQDDANQNIIYSHIAFSAIKKLNNRIGIGTTISWNYQMNTSENGVQFMSEEQKYQYDIDLKVSYNLNKTTDSIN